MMSSILNGIACAKGYLQVNSELGEIRLGSSEETAQKDALYTMQNGEGETVIGGFIDLGEGSLSVIAKPASEETVEQMKAFVQQIAWNLLPYSGQTTLTVEEVPVSDDWLQDIVVSDKVLSLKRGEDKAIISPYSSSLTGVALPNETKTGDSWVFRYGEYWDEEEGLSAFVTELERGALKVLAPNVEALLSLFPTVADKQV